MEKDRLVMNFEELPDSNNKFKFVSSDKYIFVLCDKNLSVDDQCFDEINNYYIFVLNIKITEDMNEINYLYLDKEFNFIKCLKETEGINPKFIKAPDKSMWVSLSYIKDDGNNEIVLPLENRNRIKKLILKKDIDYCCYFEWETNFIGYNAPMFGEKKNDKLSIYQFDKKSLYKGKKNIKLDFSSAGFPFVESNICFIHKTLYLNDLCSINLKEVTKEGKLLSEWNSENINDIHMIFPISVISNVKIFISTNKKNEIKLVKFNEKGELISNDKLISIDHISNFFTLSPIVLDNKNHCAVVYTSEYSNGAILFINDTLLKKVEMINGELIINKEYIYKFYSRVYFNILNGLDNLYIIATPINSKDNKDNAFVILK